MKYFRNFGVQFFDQTNVKAPLLNDIFEVIQEEITKKENSKKV